MGAAIWSSSLQEMRRFPLPLFLRFFENHGLLDIRDRPQWYVVPGGSREYVRALLAGLGDRTGPAAQRAGAAGGAPPGGSYPAAGVRGGAF